MAERRMFAKTIINSDAFTDMPFSAQALYVQLATRADDDGFINNPKQIQRMLGAPAEDLELLIKERFILSFDSGVVVIKHWKIHNYIQKDRYKPTIYADEFSKLSIKKNGAYTECIQDVYSMDTQDRKEEGEDREGEVISFTHSEREGDMNMDNVENDLSDPTSRREHLGGIGKGVVLLSDDQIASLLDKLSIAEFDKYVGIVADEELKGHKYTKRTHYQAILDMAAKDRKTR